MACDEPGSWADYAAGLGLDRPVSGSDLDTLVAFYRDRGRSPKIQITPYQHSSLLSGLASRGFTANELSTFLVHPLHGLKQHQPTPGLTFCPIDPTSADDVSAFVDSQMLGFFDGKPPHLGAKPIARRVATHDRSQLWLIKLHETIVGSGGLEMFEDSAVLIAGCINPEARRQGLQREFIQFRLKQAVEYGARYATVGSVAGGPTERNALRAGFSIGFTHIDLKLP